MGFWSKLFHLPHIPKAPTYTIDINDLDQSLNLLRKKTLEVSEAAVNAARVLEDKLEDSEYRFFSTIDSVDDMIVVKDGLGRWKTANTFTQHLFKLHNYNFVGKTDSQLIQSRSEFAECFNLCHLSDEVTWKSKQSQRFDEAIPYEDDFKYFDVIKTPIFDQDGGRKEIIIIGRDVTEVKSKEGRMKACYSAMNSVSDLIVILDKVGSIFFCNDQFLKTFHISNYNYVVGKKLSNIIEHLSYMPEYELALEQLKSNKEWHGIIQDQFTINIMPVKNGIPSPVYYICTLKPIANK